MLLPTLDCFPGLRLPRHVPEPTEKISADLARDFPNKCQSSQGNEALTLLELRVGFGHGRADGDGQQHGGNVSRVFFRSGVSGACPVSRELYLGDELR